MILKSALKQLRKNLFMNILIIIQLAAVMTILCVLVSMIESRMELYLPFADEINSKGYLCEFEGTEVTNDQKILDNVNGAKCEFTYVGDYTVNIHFDDVDQNNESIYGPNIDVMTEKWIEAYTPQMQNGSWLNELPDDGYIHAVVTQDNELRLKTGDIFTLNDSLGEAVEAMVIGVMKDEEYAVGYSAFMQTDLANRMNFLDMYYTYNSKVENKWGLFLPKSEVENAGMSSNIVCGMSFVLCDGLSESEMKEVYNYLIANSSGYTASLEEIKKNSLDYINEQFYVLLPIALCIFLLTLITTVSVISISVDSQLRVYAVFYICGAKWHDCAFISFLYSLIVCMLSGLISTAAIIILMNKSLTVIKLGILELLIMLFSAAVYLVLSAIIPILIICNNQPNDILKKE